MIRDLNKIFELRMQKYFKVLEYQIILISLFFNVYDNIYIYIFYIK